MNRLKKTADFIEKLMNILFVICGFLTIAFMLLIMGFLAVSGVPAISEIGLINFIFGTKWASTATNPSYGILPFILSSAYGTCGAILIGVPIGVLCAIFLAKMSKPVISKIVSSAVDLISGIPSVVYGLVGMIVVVPAVREVFNLADGANLFSAIIVLTIMILPVVISVSETAIQAVPKEYEEASLALGATKTETVFKVIVPAAKSGIFTSIVLGVGRSIGEAMAVMMVAGNVANMPRLFTSVRFLTTAITSEMSYSSGLQREALFSIALVLFIFIMMINIVINLAAGKKER